MTGGPATASAGSSTGELISRLSEQTSALIRDEMRLAQAEYKDKAKHAATGLGMFGAGGLLAFFGLAALVAAAIIGLAEVVPWWASALIVAGALLLVAGLVWLVGKKQVAQVTPATPQRAMGSLKRDITEVKEHAKS